MKVLRVKRQKVRGFRSLWINELTQPVAVNDEVPRRIGGWFTLESIAKPSRIPLGPMVTSGLPTTRKLARSVNPSAFLGTNPTDESIVSGLLVTRELFGDLMPCTLLTQRRRYFEGRGDSCRLWAAILIPASVLSKKSAMLSRSA